MPRKVFVSRDADNALADARDWFEQFGSGPAAWRKWRALRDAPDALLAFPYRGRPSRDFKGCRQLIVSGYRIIYEIHPDTGDRATAGDVYILAIFGPGQP